MIDRRYQWLIILVLALAVVGGIYYATLGFIRRDSSEVVISVLPTYATITIDGKKSGQGSQFLSEGSHKIEVSASGFKTTTQTINVEKDSKETFLASLIPVNSEGEKWVQEHAKLYENFEDKGATSAREKGIEMQETYPILELLPYTEDDYTIGYRSPKEGELIVTIHATTSLTRQLALARIESWGYDPAEYTIDFVNFRDPFGHDGEIERR